MSLPVRSQSGLSQPEAPRFEEFLFADIGVQSNGLPLTILTLLARGGHDPWVEAERLSRMSRTAAVSCMIAEINRAPACYRRRDDVGELAKSLVARLPKPAPRAPVDVWMAGSGFEGVPMLALMTMLFAIMTIALLAVLLES